MGHLRVCHCPPWWRSVWASDSWRARLGGDCGAAVFVRRPPWRRILGCLLRLFFQRPPWRRHLGSCSRDSTPQKGTFSLKTVISNENGSSNSHCLGRGTPRTIPRNPRAASLDSRTAVGGNTPQGQNKKKNKLCACWENVNPCSTWAARSEGVSCWFSPSSLGTLSGPTGSPDDSFTPLVWD